MVGELRFSTELHAFGLGALAAFARAGADQLALKLRQAARERIRTVEISLRVPGPRGAWSEIAARRSLIRLEGSTDRPAEMRCIAGLR